MRMLLDTHVMIRWLRDNPRLGMRTRAAIADPRAELLVSIASFWELSIKTQIGKWAEPGSALIGEARSAGLIVVDVAQRHLAAFEALPFIADHKDLFDHLILAQAIAEDAILVTGDRKLRAYDVPCFGFT